MLRQSFLKHETVEEKVNQLKQCIYNALTIRLQMKNFLRVRSKKIFGDRTKNEITCIHGVAWTIVSI